MVIIILDLSKSISCFLFQVELAALLHDIGNPLKTLHPLVKHSVKLVFWELTFLGSYLFMNVVILFFSM